jgi:adenylate kinase
MTEQMSVPGVSAPMLDGTVVDDQLRRSQHPACVAALQAYQREIGSHARRWDTMSPPEPCRSADPGRRVGRRPPWTLHAERHGLANGSGVPGSAGSRELGWRRETQRRGRGGADRALRIVLLGPPGAGKGTQALRLAPRFGVPHIATGDIFRANVDRGTPLGRVAKRYMDGGELVPDDLVIDIVSQRLVEPDCRHGFLLDGFPRSVPQARALSRRLDELGTPLDAAISLEVEQEELFGRLATRARADDTEQTIRNRLRVFAASNAALLRYYEQRGLLVRVNAVGDPDEITELVVARLEDLARPLAERRPVAVALALIGGQ